MTSWQGKRIDTDEHARHRLHAGERDRLLPRRGATASRRRSSRRRGFVRVAICEAPGLRRRARARSGIRRTDVRLRRRRRTDGSTRSLCRRTIMSASVAFYRKLGFGRSSIQPGRYARFECPGGATLSIHVDRKDDRSRRRRRLPRMRRPRRRVERLARPASRSSTAPQRPAAGCGARRGCAIPPATSSSSTSAGETRRFPPWRIEGDNPQRN